MGSVCCVLENVSGTAASIVAVASIAGAALYGTVGDARTSSACHRIDASDNADDDETSKEILEDQDECKTCGAMNRVGMLHCESCGCSLFEGNDRYCFGYTILAVLC